MYKQCVTLLCVRLCNQNVSLLSFWFCRRYLLFVPFRRSTSKACPIRQVPGHQLPYLFQNITSAYTAPDCVTELCISTTPCFPVESSEHRSAPVEYPCRGQSNYIQAGERGELPHDPVFLSYRSDVRQIHNYMCYAIVWHDCVFIYCFDLCWISSAHVRSLYNKEANTWASRPFCQLPGIRIRPPPLACIPNSIKFPRFSVEQRLFLRADLHLIRRQSKI